MSEPRPLTVSELTASIKMLLEESYPDVHVTGEIGNLTRARSGHIYLTLKDQGATLSSVVWRSAAQRIRIELEEGMEVLARGRLNLYPPRGQYQLDIRALEPLGIGSLMAALEKRRDRLAAEGLFDPERKHPIPFLPVWIGVVTSPTGAAIRDVLKVLGRRHPGVSVVLAPARVQGDGAEEEIARGIERLNERGGLDVLIVGRGGGSFEDLLAFQSERVARAIAASRIPVISAVGHEVDVTIADLVADLRAPTPSAAAELAVPALADLRYTVARTGDRLAAAGRRLVADRRDRLEALTGAYGLRRFPDRLREWEQRLDDLAGRVGRSIRERLGRARESLGELAGRSEALSPLRVLARGYSVTMPAGKERPVRSAREIEIGDRVRTRLATGSFVSRVEEVDRGEEE